MPRISSCRQIVLIRRVPRRFPRLSDPSFTTRPVSLSYLPNQGPNHCQQFRMASGATRSGRTYCFQEYVENLERYRAGGYHPTYIDDELSGGRYRIVQKLGFGSYSTVWLAKDGKNDKYVAIKIGVSENAQLSREVSVLKYLSRAGLESKSLGRDQIPRLLDHFLVGGPNGQHQCLVFEPSRCSLSESKYESRTGLFPLDAARAIATQLILGVAYLHSFGVVHGGKSRTFDGKLWS